MEDIFSIEHDQEVNDSITFSYLQSLTSEAVADSVSQETALEVCKRSLENLSAKHIDLLGLWLQKLLKVYFSKTICCIEAFKCLYVWFTKLKDEVSANDKIACSNYYKLLTDALDFAEWAKGKLVKVGERLGHTTAYFLLSIVSSCLQLSLEEASKNLRPADVAQAAEYYIKCNNSYALFSQHTSQWYVQRMLKYFHKLAPKETPLFTMRNYRYLHCVSPRAEQDQRMWMMRLQRILIAPLSDVEQYYEILALMELLATDQNDWLHLIADSVKHIISVDNCQLLCKIFFKLSFHSNQLMQQRLLQDAMPTQNCVNNSWYLQKLIHDGQRSDVHELKSLANTRTLAAELLPILGALQSKEFESRATVLPKTLSKWDFRSSRGHCCNVGNLKRKRSQKPNEFICQIEQNVKELLNYSDELDASNLEQLKALSKILANLC
ncbi:hypothetical protein KR093_001051 [Drosophila rubida]|uniref:Uncharacterized protein n=1 Tax=Drosophila rubida TaxID=30044 RepID=A0AAD4JXL3_9MUSC|nr:hypothetical protein KR093_001051 [Drosophila rubida]